MKIEELLEQIEIAEAEFEELKEMKLKYEQDQWEGFDRTADLAGLRRKYMRAEDTLDSLRDRLKTERAIAANLAELREARNELDSLERVTKRLGNA